MFAVCASIAVHTLLIGFYELSYEVIVFYLFEVQRALSSKRATRRHTCTHAPWKNARRQSAGEDGQEHFQQEPYPYCLQEIKGVLATLDTHFYHYIYIYVYAHTLRETRRP